MPEYFAPGVYIEEVPPSSQPIAGVSTSVAGFIGVIPDTLYQPQDQLQIGKITNEEVVKGGDNKFTLSKYPVDTNTKKFTIKIDGAEQADATLEDDKTNKKTTIKFKTEPTAGKKVTVDYNYIVLPVQTWKITNEEVVKGGDNKFTLSKYPVDTNTKKFTIKIDDTEQADATLEDDNANKKTTIKFKTEPTAGKKVTVDYNHIVLPVLPSFNKLDISQKLEKITSFDQLKQKFGDISYYDNDSGNSPEEENRYLTHAVLGFFNNGGTVCYVKRYQDKKTVKDKITNALEEFGKINEIGVIAVPGNTDATVREAVLNHCENFKDRFAVLDGEENPGDGKENDADTIKNGARNSHFGAIYYPWLKVADPLSPEEPVSVPPSGHVVGVYARTDSERGVFKAPANEVIRGVLDVKIPLNSVDQGGLNPKGINVIRTFGGTVKIYGARTIGGDANGAFKYVSTRRTMSFLRKSIEQAMEFAVFEPNTPDLWARITRNVSDFLLGQWRDGALFGDDPKKAFFVRCDENTNPPDVRERGQVVTEIGVAIVKPAEFVIFKIQQLTGG
ncbi:MAG: hypothetical protein N5P05_004400 (plasmid) [Chroococcopsis gigantea SAG 12.99]|jgi:phage tail sheath protein FI|nr:hypothetical protein [Chroococcopsis gigantea SAG 12.99]